MADTDTTVICRSCGARWEYGEYDKCPNCGFEGAHFAVDGSHALPERAKAAPKTADAPEAEPEPAPAE